MANTYTQLYIHIVFTVKNRACFIQEPFREELEKYICGIATQRGHKPLAVYCMPDHVHLFVGLNPAEAVSTLVGNVKTGTSALIKERRWIQSAFHWQEG